MAIDSNYPSKAGLYDPALLKEQQCEIVSIYVEPTIYTGHTEVKMLFIIELKFPEERFWDFFLSDDNSFMDLQEAFYKKSPFYLESSADWDYDEFTLSFWAKTVKDKSVRFIPSVEEYFNMLNRFNHY